MEDPTILSEIIQRVDDETLQKLSGIPSLWELIKKDLEEDYFWYSRTKNLTGMDLIPRPGANWKMIYQFIKSDASDVYDNSLDDLDKLKVSIEVYGPPYFKKYKDVPIPWSKATNLDVLKYLIDQGYISYTSDSGRIGLEEAAKHGRIEIVEFFLTMPDVDTEKNIISALHEAARYGYLDIVKLLLNKIHRLMRPQIVEDILVTAASGGSIEVVVFLLGHKRIPDNQLARAAERAASYRRIEVLPLILDRIDRIILEVVWRISINASDSGHTEVVQLLIKMYPSRVRLPDRNTLNKAIKANHYDFVEYLLTMISPATKGNQALKLAASLDHPTVLKILLSDPRTDPNSDLAGVMVSSSYGLRRDKRLVERLLTAPKSLLSWANPNSHLVKAQEYNSDLIIRDERVDLDKASSDSLRIILWTLTAHIEDRVQGFLYANDLAGGKKMSPEDVGDLIEGRSGGNDTYSYLLRFIIIKRPSGEDLLKWILKHRDRYSREAARSLLKEEMPESGAIPIWSLMLAILDISLKEIIDILKDEDVEGTEIILSARLIGAYLGKAASSGEENIS